MHIGLDFDNTIIRYDEVFHAQALRGGLIDGEVAVNKRLIRDHIRRVTGGNREWIELQGLVYGTLIGEAEPAPGVERFIGRGRDAGAAFSVISHKTVYPAGGPKIDLRRAALRWLEEREFFPVLDLQPPEVVFTATRAEKLEAIAGRGCEVFIDDLSEVLLDPRFPAGVEPILYSPVPEEDLPESIRSFTAWDDIGDYLFG